METKKTEYQPQHQHGIERSRNLNTSFVTRHIQNLKEVSQPTPKDMFLLQHQSKRPTQDKSASSSKSTVESLEYILGESRSDETRSRISRLDFDGSVVLLSQMTLAEEKPRERYLHSNSEVERHQSVQGNVTLSGSLSSNIAVENTSNSRFSRQSNTAIQLLNIFNKYHIKRKAKAKRTANIGPGDGNIELVHEKCYLGDEESVRSRSTADCTEQSSWYAFRSKIVVYAIICCTIIAASISVPFVFLFGDSPNSIFLELSQSKRSVVVTNIKANICNELVPQSGTCTPTNFVEEKQGSELCNLVAKSLINTTVHVDVALINAGICKQTLFAPDLTIGSIEDAIVAESLVVVEILGVDIINVLTQALATTFGKPGSSEAYPYAAGLRYNVAANLPPSERLSDIEVNRGVHDDTWEAIDARRFYKVITTEVLASGAMGYASFQNVIDDWKTPLHIKTSDVFYNYAMAMSNNAEWSVLPRSEYSTQYFSRENEEPLIATVPTRICHAYIPGRPKSPFCTAVDVVHGGDVCNFVSWAIYDQNFSVDMVVLKGDSCSGDIEEGDFVESSFETVLSKNQSLITIDLLGSEIISMIDSCVTSAVYSDLAGDYPYAAGLKFGVNSNASPKVFDVQVLGSNGNWTQIVGTKTYIIATTPALASSLAAKDLKTSIKEEIKNYAEDWGVLYKPSAGKISTQSYV